jgi:hypothetical protein
MDMITDAGRDYGDSGLRWQSSAILALQEASEAFLVHLFEDAYVFASEFGPPSRYNALLFTQESVCYSCETSYDYDP